MSADLNDQSEIVRQLLIDKLHDWKDGVSPVWNSTWPVFDRLIIRHHEMIAVYEELAEQGITGTRLWILLEQLILPQALALRRNMPACAQITENLTVSMKPSAKQAASWPQ